MAIFVSDNPVKLLKSLPLTAFKKLCSCYFNFYNLCWSNNKLEKDISCYVLPFVPLFGTDPEIHILREPHYTRKMQLTPPASNAESLSV